MTTNFAFMYQNFFSLEGFTFKNGDDEFEKKNIISKCSEKDVCYKSRRETLKMTGGSSKMDHENTICIVNYFHYIVL
jgi:hypothetical protein